MSNEAPAGRSDGAPPPSDSAQETVEELAALYLGNILFALESAASTFQGEGKEDHAAFYRAIARKLAEARGREKGHR